MLGYGINLEELAETKASKEMHLSIHETLMDQAAKIRVLGGPEHLPVEPVTTQSTAVAKLRVLNLTLMPNGKDRLKLCFAWFS